MTPSKSDPETLEASPKEMRARLLAAARGEAEPATKEGKLWKQPKTEDSKK